MNTSPSPLTAFCSVRRIGKYGVPVPAYLEFRSDAARIHDDVATAFARLGIDDAVTQEAQAHLANFSEGVSFEARDGAGERVVLYVNQCNAQLQRIFDDRYRKGEALPELEPSADPVASAHGEGAEEPWLVPA